jgi:Glutathione S-transferase, N-terminal domain
LLGDLRLSVTLYYASGSPYAWRAWLALEHKGVAYHHKLLSFDAGHLKTPEYAALNPRQRVPVLVDDDFALYESAAIVEYIEDRWPNGPALFTHEPRKRAIQRRMVHEADQYFRILAGVWARARLGRRTEGPVQGVGLLGKRRDRRRELSAVDLTVFPFVALLLRLAGRRADFAKDDTGPSRRLDRPHADASRRSAHLASALEASRSNLTARLRC